MDVTPVGYIPLHECFVRLAKWKTAQAGEQPADKTQFQEWYNKTSRLTDEAEAKLQDALISGALEVRFYNEEHDRFYVASKSDLEDTPMFGRLFWRLQIVALHDEPLFRYNGRVPIVEVAKFEPWMRAIVEGDGSNGGPAHGPHLTHSGLSGRPTAKHLYLSRLDQRITDGSAMIEDVTAEAGHLHQWLKDTYPDVASGTIKTIVNNIAPVLKRARASRNLLK